METIQAMVSIGIGVISVCAIFVTFSPVYYFYKLRETRSEIDKLKSEVSSLTSKLSEISAETESIREQYKKERNILEAAFNKSNPDS